MIVYDILQYHEICRVISYCNIMHNIMYKSKKQIHHKQDTNDREYRQNDSLDSTLYDIVYKIIDKCMIS